MVAMATRGRFSSSQAAGLVLVLPGGTDRAGASSRNDAKHTCPVSEPFTQRAALCLFSSAMADLVRTKPRVPAVP